jgi:hypothetical protein
MVHRKWMFTGSTSVLFRRATRPINSPKPPSTIVGRRCHLRLQKDCPTCQAIKKANAMAISASEPRGRVEWHMQLSRTRGQAEQSNKKSRTHIPKVDNRTDCSRPRVVSCLYQGFPISRFRSRSSVEGSSLFGGETDEVERK